MQSLTSRRDTSYISLGERRGKSDLARFSLDLSWARAASDSARLRAYPSPPMSGSPPLPPRRNPDSSDRGHGSYGSSGQDVFRGTQAPQMEQSEHRGPQFRGYLPEQGPQTSYAPLRMEDMPPGPIQYQQTRPQMATHQQPQMTPQQQHHGYPRHPQQAPAPFPTPERAAVGEPPEYTSPKQQRKTKGHVASACVPCKRAHLRCDAQRPCSRCLSNGKEDTCVDVQHKKRGRPRLRDEREPRYDSLGSGYAPPPADPSMRRPLSLYSPGNGSINTPFGDSLQRSGSYRVLKSQGPGPGPMGGPIAPRDIDNALHGDTTVYGSSMPLASRMLPSQEPLCAYLNMEMQIAKATQSFGETIGLQSIVARKFQDIVIPNDLDKVLRLQRGFEEERREREPNYLPPIYLKFEEDRVIQAVGFGPDEMGQVRADRQEVFTFQGPDGQQRSFQVRLGLAKKDSTYFIAVLLNTTTQQTFHHPSSSPFSREGYPREPQYGYQTPQQGYLQNPGPSAFGAAQGFDPGMAAFRTPGPLGSNILPSANMPTFAQTPQRQDYPPGQLPFQTPRSELPQGQTQRQRDLQLPPIRDQRTESASMGPMRQRDDRSGRVDIGGLIEKPDSRRRGA